MSGSLARRVALAAALTAAVAGLSVAVVSTLLADRIHRQRQDTRMREAAQMLANELLEGADPAATAEDERRELLHTGIRVAIDREGERAFGDEGLPSPAAGSCAETRTTRACAVRAGPLVAIAGHDVSPWNDQREAIGWASAIAVIVTTLLGALAALRVARWVLSPLARLQRAVELLDRTRPADVRLGPDEGVEEVDALRRALRVVLTQLTSSLMRSRRFARDAAHELRTPLATMLGELELLAEKTPHESADDVRRALRVAQRLGALVERLLVLARSDEPPERSEEVALLGLAEDLREELPPDLRPRVVLAGKEVSVRGDVALLSAMIANALDNALKYSTGPVRLEVAPSDAGASVVVSDEGPGIAAADRERVFEAFHRGGEAHAANVKGHGIGLALVRHVAAIHGGEARFVDTPQGARLEVQLGGRAHAT